MIFKKDWQVFLLFLLFSIILRFFSFFPSVIDHDESTYLVMASSMLKGELLYVDLIDIKPVGIFLIMAFFQLLFGNSIFMIRLISAGLVALTSFFIYKTKISRNEDKISAVNSGILYVFIISIFAFFGVSLNTELYFNFFTIIGLYFFFSKHKYKYFTSGLFFGFGFIIKYVVLFDFAALAFFNLLWFIISGQKKWFKNYFLPHFYTSLAFLVPFAITHLYYYLIGYYDDFFYITFSASGKYSANISLIEKLEYAGMFFLRFFPVTILYTLFIIHKSNSNISNYEKYFSLIWIGFVLIGIFILGHKFGHYYIQLMLPLCYFAGNYFTKYRPKIIFIRKITSAPINYILIGIFFIIVNIFSYNEYFAKKDYPKIISNYLENKLDKKDNIYTGNYQHVIYYLLDKKSPTKYVHRSLIFAEHHIHALNIDTNAVYRSIINSNPKYILYEKKLYSEKLTKYISNNYQLDTTYNKSIYLFKKSDD